MIDLLDPKLWLIGLGFWYAHLAFFQRKQTMYELLSVSVVAGGCAAIAGFEIAALYIAIGILTLLRK